MAKQTKKERMVQAASDVLMQGDIGICKLQ